jgi:hypothetical protein
MFFWVGCQQICGAGGAGGTGYPPSDVDEAVAVGGRLGGIEAAAVERADGLQPPLPVGLPRVGEQVGRSPASAAASVLRSKREVRPLVSAWACAAGSSYKSLQLDNAMGSESCLVLRTCEYCFLFCCFGP